MKNENCACFPIIVGISGHRTIAPDALASVQSSLHSTLSLLKRELGPALHLVTGLAEGSDQLAAKIAGELNIPHIAVLPMKIDAFRSTLSSEEARRNVDFLWAHSVLRLELPAIASESQDAVKLQYEQLGAVLTRFSHILIVLWDAIPWPEDNPSEQQELRGGTSHVVHLRIHGEASAEGFRKSVIFQNVSSHLDMAGGGPMIHIFTPRTGQAGREQNAGSIHLAGTSGASTPEEVVTHLLADSVNLAPKPFAEILHLNEREEKFNGHYQAIQARQIDFLGISDHTRSDSDLAYLCQRQAAVDTAAQYYQHRLLGEVATTATLPQGLWQVLGTLIRSRRMPQMGIVFIYAMVLIVAIALFECYAHIAHNVLLLSFHLAFIGGALGLHTWQRHKRMWQNRFQDYRAMAEAMRVQIYWALGGIPNAVSDHYMRKKRDELGWITFALRGPALWSIAVALEHRFAPDRETINKAWLMDQKHYFLGDANQPGKAAQNNNSHHRCHLHRNLYFAAAIFLTFVLLLAEAAMLEISNVQSLVPSLIAWHWAWSAHDAHFSMVRDILITAIVMLLAFGGSVHFVAEKFAYEAHALSYLSMGKLFSHAVDQSQVGDCANNTEAYQQLLTELGREALTEHADWLEDHRRREVAPEHLA